tara:strand:+ start:521 stop:928 length:408 start_codon:yes stop_codon:yes gene_type:complete
MSEMLKKGIEVFIAGFLILTSVRKLVYIFSEVYIDIPSISYLTNSPDVAIYVLTGISIFELITAFFLIFGKDKLRKMIFSTLIVFMSVGIIYSVIELIFFGTSCFCGISKSPLISISAKVIVLMLLLLFLDKKKN